MGGFKKKNIVDRNILVKHLQRSLSLMTLAENTDEKFSPIGSLIEFIIN